MIKIVLDSNVLVSALGIRSALRLIWDAFTSGGVQIVVSEDILRECEEILQQHSAPGAAEIVMKIIDESPDVFFKGYLITGTRLQLMMNSLTLP